MRTALLCAAAILVGCADPEIGSRDGSPLDHLPDNISLLHPEGMRADFSGDGERLLFLDALIGNVHEIELASGNIRPLTAHFEHGGFTRARYLANGDVLLCGPDSIIAENSEDGGRWHSVMWHLSAALDKPASTLNEVCHEGPAVARNSMTIAWTVSDFPDKVVFGRSELWTATLDLSGAAPELTDMRMVMDRSRLFYFAFLETQDFRPPEENELLFTAYAWAGGEAMGIDLTTGDLVNYSNNWGYDEAEGVFPDGESIAVEREPHTYTAVPKGDIDIWRLALDGSGEYERMTRFTDFAGYGASNPVISPDGRYMAFQLRIKGGDHGNGAGLLLYELDRLEVDRLEADAREDDRIEAIMTRIANGEEIDDSDYADDSEFSDADEPICCESFGYGSMMKKCCESYEITAPKNCRVPLSHTGGDRRIVADSFCKDPANH